MSDFARNKFLTAEIAPADYSRELTTKDPTVFHSQMRLVILIALCVSICEALVMIILSSLSPFPVWLETLLESILLVILLSPVLYFCLFRTLIRHIAERERAEAELKEHYDHLEGLVAERTAELKTANERLKQENSESKVAAEVLQKRTHELGERVKELNCLYKISDLIEKPGISLEEVLQGTVSLIPPAWQYPEITCARVALEDQEFTTENFRETIWKQECGITLNGEQIGILEICLLEEKPESGGVSFLPEERSLITVIAERLGNIIQQKRTYIALHKALKESKAREAEIAALLDGSRAVLEHQRFNDAARSIFDSCKNLIGATAGYVALLNEDGTENEVLFLDSGGLPCSVDPSLPMPIRGLRSEAYRRTKAVCHNDFPHSEWTGFLPDGHVRIDNVLFTPLVIDGKSVGVIGLANKPDGFTENDVRMATAFGELSAIALINSRTLESLENSEERFRSVVESAVEAIISVDHHGDIISWNHGAEISFGYSTEEVVGKPITLIIPEEFREAHKSELSRAVSTGKTDLTGKILKGSGLRRDGSRFPLELSLASWKTREGMFFTAIIRDISEITRAEEALNRLNFELEERVKERTSELQREIIERKRVEEEIRRNKAMLQSVFDGISDPLILLDNNLTVKMLNKAAMDYYQVDQSMHVSGSSCYQTFRGKSDPCEECEVLVAISNSQDVTFQRKGFMDPNLFEQVAIYPLRQNGNEMDGVILRISDITEAKLMERQIIQNEKLASLGLLVSGVAHEINNPNSFITFNIPILRDYLNEVMLIVDDYAEDQKSLELFGMNYPEFRKDLFRILDNIEHGSSRINTTVVGLKEFARTRVKKEMRWIDLKEVVEKSLNISRGVIRKRVKNLEVKIPEDLPKVYTDPDALEQVLINLLVNSGQAADKEISWVRLQAAIGHTWTDHLIIELSDNGRGMNEKTMEKIFEPFFTTKSPTEGTGLGLYVCQSLIEGLGGRIEVNSEPEKGSTFRVILTDKDRRRVPRA